MISFKHVNKDYRVRRGKVHALRDIDLSLPEKGLVFVLGKSGSGKTTLLNLMAGLDGVTSGAVEFCGNNLSKLSERRLANYRSQHVGFVFQDSHLLHDLTVFENIALSLELQEDRDAECVQTALERVGLSGYGTRYPHQLSGGERQRVAMARAIVKKPSIILADEPTGNLDGESADMIVDILRSLSRECLVVVVSHHTQQALCYADRIIRLESGRVTSDVTRNADASERSNLQGDIFYYPDGSPLSAEEIELLNQSIERKELKRIVKATDTFLESVPLAEDENKQTINKKRLTFSSALHIARIFFQKKIIGVAVVSLMLALLVTVLSVLQSIALFDAEQVLNEHTRNSKQEVLLFEKTLSAEQQQLLGENYHVEVTQADIQEFRDAGYTGEIRSVLSYTVPITQSVNSMGVVNPYFSDGVFINESLGTVIADEELLSKRFNGVRYLATADRQHPAGVIITDYLADAILNTNGDYSGKTYDDLVGYYSFGGNSGRRAYINAIIRTGYRAKYQRLIQKYLKDQDLDLIAISKHSDFSSFMQDVYGSLGLCYTLNPNFVSDFSDSRDFDFVWHQRLRFDGGDDFVGEDDCYVLVDQDRDYYLTRGDVVMSYTKYNQIFGTSYTADTYRQFKSHSVSLEQFRLHDVSNKHPLFETEITIVRLIQDFSGLMIVDDQTYAQFARSSVWEKGLYFDCPEQFASVLRIAGSLGFEQQIPGIEGIREVTEIVEAFSPVFRILHLILCISVVFVFLLFGMKLVRDRRKDIGILKAMGMKNGALCLIFGLQIFAVALFTAMLSIVGYAWLVDEADVILRSSLENLALQYPLSDVRLLTFRLNIAITDSALVFLLAAVSLALPILCLHRIKPIRMIKKREADF